MKKILIGGIFALIIPNIIWSQDYKKTNRTYIDKEKISIEDINNYFWHGYENTLRVYHRDSASNLVIDNINLDHLKKTDQKIIKLKNINNFHITDVSATKNYDVIVGNERMLIYNRKEDSIYFTENDHDHHEKNKNVYNKVSKINDTLICLYSIYSYHPLDGFPGFHLNIYNLNTQKFISSIEGTFQGIMFSPFNSRWLFTDGQGISVTSPLTGKTYRYDLQLKLTDSTILPIPWKNAKANDVFQRVTDSLTYAHYIELNSVANTFNIDSARHLANIPPYVDFYGKDYLQAIIDSTHKNYEYIEKIIPEGDTGVVVTIAKPGYERQYRDIIFYNTVSKRATGSMSKWLCIKKDTSSQIEDFFTLNLSSTIKTEPYFYHGKAYTVTFYNPEIYQNGNKEDLEKKLVKDISTNGCHFYTLEFKVL